MHKWSSRCRIPPSYPQRNSAGEMKSTALRILLLYAIFAYGASWNVEKRDVYSFFKREKCIPVLGCFSAGAPFFDFVERPLSLLPDDREDINVRFLLYTARNPNVTRNFSNLRDNTLFKARLERGGFNASLPTKFIVPGYISNAAPHWKMPLKDALLQWEPSNVFHLDWSDGDGPLYEQAVANTRVVGAELALFINKLQEKVGVKPETVHILGHSLGSHIAGYAGKHIKGLGRITAMDPAGPYFTNVDPVVRLDRNDAMLVDAVHTNAAPNRFQGFGLTESIGHFDFWPNGGHLQPGCLDLGHAVWSFITHPTLDEAGTKELQCNHGRAIDLVLSSFIENEECELKGITCPSWEKFAKGRCTDCTKELCVPLGARANKFADRISPNKSIDLYLRTTDLPPFCPKVKPTVLKTNKTAL